MLKDEAVCRGNVLKQLPKTKAGLLEYLGDGSVHLQETRAWKAVEAIKTQMQRALKDVEDIKAQMQAERTAHLSKVNEAKQEMERFQRIKEMEMHRVRQEKFRKTQEQKDVQRAKEIELQKALHTHSFPMVHSHLLARTSELKDKGVARQANCHNCADNSYYGLNAEILWTCETCDFDVCRECFEKMKTQDERDKIRARQHKERELYLAQEAHRQKELQTAFEGQRHSENEGCTAICDEKQQFKKAIIQPPASNKDTDGSMMQGFTVFSTQGDLPEQILQFDSTWKTAADANARALYLIVGENVFGMAPDEVGPYDESETNGLKKYSSASEDGSLPWTVRVVPDVAFPHLLNEELSYSAWGRQNMMYEMKAPISSDDASRQFKKEIMCPLASNKDSDGSMMQGFTVFSTQGDLPEQILQFDSTWKTAADANARALYLICRGKRLWNGA
jgi:hypothetical protein